MFQVDQYLKRFADNLARLTPGNVDNKPDAAAVVLEPGIVETLSFW
jgi:hypothetical protein